MSLLPSTCVGVTSLINCILKLLLGNTGLQEQHNVEMQKQKSPAALFY